MTESKGAYTGESPNARFVPSRFVCPSRPTRDLEEQPRPYDSVCPVQTVLVDTGECLGPRPRSTQLD